MIFGSFVDCTIASGTTSAATDLGRPYEWMAIVMPASLSSGTISVYGSETSGGTYTQLYITNPTDGTNEPLTSDATTGSIVWVVPIGGFQFIKIVSGASQTTKTFRVRGFRR
jgi:hypothetical protein